MEVIMPALGMAQENGLLVAWLKKEGETVRQGEPLMEVETDKATVEIEAEADGVLINVAVEAGESVPVGTVIARIASPEEAKAAAGQRPAGPEASAANGRQEAEGAAGDGLGPAAAATPVAARIAREHHVDLGQVKGKGQRITKADVLMYLSSREQRPPSRLTQAASPLARRLAQEAGIDLALISGSGPSGAVIAADVRVHATTTEVAAQPAAPVAAPAQPAPSPISRRWQVMAERLEASWQTVPHFYLQREVDASQLLAWHASVKARATTKVTVTDLLVVAVAHALRQHPRVNASWTESNVTFNERINVGLAVAVEDGLLVPVIHEADKLGLFGVAARRRELIERTTSEKLKPADLQGGTFTISNLGMYGVDNFNAIVNPPEAAILAVGRIREQVVPQEGVPTIKPIMTLSLSCDHRVVDGARGAEFLQTLTAYLQEPLTLLD